MRRRPGRGARGVAAGRSTVTNKLVTGFIIVLLLVTLALIIYFKFIKTGRWSL